MDINASGNLPGAPTVAQTPILKDKSQEVSPDSTPVDKVEQGAPQEAGLVHKGFRGLGKMVGGVLGTVPGAFKGGIKGAATEEPHQIVDPNGIKVLRATGAAGTTILTSMAGLMSFGIPGMLVGLVAGPILGSAFAESMPGALDGAYAATKGAVKGAWGGMKKGAEIGGKFVDWVASKFPEKPPAEEPKPPAQEPKPPAQEPPPANP